MKFGEKLAHPICWAISTGQVPDDIARQLQKCLEVFQVDAALFDSDNLQGPAKHAELVVKLGYWLVTGQLQEQEFRTWADCVPPKDNAGWDVDLLHSPPGSQVRPVLKMGPICSSPEACLVQDAAWDAPRP
jgi:hypothetical protein